MAIQQATAGLIASFYSAVAPLKILSTDIFIGAESTGNQIVAKVFTAGKETVDYVRIQGGFVGITPSFSVVADRIAMDEELNFLPGFRIAGFLNKSTLRTNTPVVDTFYDNITLAEAQKNYGINIISRAILNVRVPTAVTIDMSKVQVPIVNLATYTVEVEEGFFKQQSVISDDPLLTNINNEMATSAFLPLVQLRTNSRPFWVLINPTNGTTTNYINTKISFRIYSTNNEGETGFNILNTIIPGTGFIKLYREGVLVSTISCFDSKVTFVENRIEVDYTGLIDADTNYYILIDNGFAVDRDGFATQAVTSTTQCFFRSAPSTDPAFPDLTTLQVSAANLLLPQSEIVIFFEGDLVAEASVSCDAERVKYMSGTTDSIGGVVANVSALVEATDLEFDVLSSQITAGTFVIAEGYSNMLVSLSLDFFIKLEPTTISAQFSVPKMEISIRKPAEFNLTTSTSIYANGGYILQGSAFCPATSSLSCSTTAVAKAMVLRYNADTGSVLRLPLYGNVNVTVEWGGGTNALLGYSGGQGYIFYQNAPGRTAYYGDGFYREYNGGGFKQVVSYTTPGVKTFTVPSIASATSFNGLPTRSINDFDGYVIIKGQLDYLGALESQDSLSFDSGTTQSSASLAEILSWGELGLKGFRRVGSTRSEANVVLYYINPNMPSTVTDLTNAFSGRMSLNYQSFSVSSTEPPDVVWGVYPFTPDETNPENAEIVFRAERYRRVEWEYRSTLVPIKNTIENLNTSNVTKMEGTFQKATLGYEGGNSPNYIFYYLNLAGWNTSNVTTMKSMFQASRGLAPKGLENWNTGLVSDMSYMFNRTSYSLPLNDGTTRSTIDNTIDIGSWNTASVTTMKAMFGMENFPLSGISNNLPETDPSRGAYNGRLPSLASWNTANVTDMSFMFCGWRTDIQSPYVISGSLALPTLSLGLNNWNTSKVTTMKAMFAGTGFADDLNTWDVSKVADFSWIFSGTASVIFGRSDWNPNVTNWNTSSATLMTGMFFLGNGFNRSILRNGNIWNTSKVTDMNYMFYVLDAGYETFNQDLSGWCVPLIASLPTAFFSGRQSTWTNPKPIWGTCP